MATHAITWTPGAHVHFGDLDFIITLEGELALTHSAAPSLPSINLSRLRLEGPPGNSLGVRSPREVSHNVTLCPEGPVRSAPTAFPFFLHNAAATASHLLALRMVQSPTDIEFVGAIEHDTETLYGLLNEEPGSFSSSDSSRGSHHPSRECFMTQTPEGHVESASREEVTPTNNPDSRSGEETTAPSGLRMEQLKARQQEIDEAGQGLVREYADINREIKRRKDGGRARAMARTVHQRILTDDGTLPHFA